MHGMISNILKSNVIVSLLIIFYSHLNATMIVRSRVLMGTFVTIKLDKKDISILHPSFRLIKKIETSISSFKKTSPIYKLNHYKKARLNHYSYKALMLSLKFYKQTNGYFDIAIGKITKDLYRFGNKQRIASKKDLNHANVSIQGLSFNKKEAYLRNNIKIDLGGMGKGFGIDRIVKFYKQHDIKHAIIAFSGDIRCIGICKIHINNPFSTIPLISFSMKNMGISTSGNYNHYVKSVQNNHLINPKTKLSELNFISVTLISQLPNSYLDAYATAVSVMPKQKAYKFLSIKNIAYIILESNNKLIISKNINQFVQHLVINYTAK